MNMKKILALALCLVLVAGLSIGGTIAWITASTTKITNTFTVGDINITLAESDNLDLKIIPGKTITKDPVVTVNADSEACWLFVKIEESANFGTYMTYGVADGWNPLAGHAGVYYREVAATTAKVDFPVLKDDEVVVGEGVTKTQVEAAKTNAPTLSFTAYAIQKEGITSATDAWDKLGV